MNCFFHFLKSSVYILGFEVMEIHIVLLFCETLRIDNLQIISNVCIFQIILGELSDT